MSYSSFNKIILTSFLVLFSFFSLAQAKSELPPILDYYPNCSYEVIDKTKIKIITETPLSIKIVDKLLEKIQIRAKKADADAVILTAKKVKKYKNIRKGSGNSNNSNNSAVFSRKASGETKYLVRYHAELINLCEENSDEKRKRTPLNHQGLRIIDTKSKVISTISHTITIASKVVTKRPTINNDEVSLKHGVYGVEIGSSYQHVIDMLGKPSVKLKVMVNEVVLGYGRRHWFYFQSDKLVNIQNNSAYLSQDMINKVPTLDFFDDFLWQINQKVVYKMLLSDVKSALNITTKLNNQDQLVLKGDANTLTLNFIFNRDQRSLEKSYELIGFTLKANNYKQNKQRIAVRSKAQFKVIDHLYSQLRNSQEIQKDKLLEQLGAPIGFISLSRYSDLNIYNNNLLILVKREEINKLYLIEDALANGQSHRWSLGKIIQGISVKKSQKYLDKEAIFLFDKVEVNADNYALSLMFDELNGEDIVYEAQIDIY